MLPFTSGAVMSLEELKKNVYGLIKFEEFKKISFLERIPKVLVSLPNPFRRRGCDQKIVTLFSSVKASWASLSSTLQHSYPNATIFIHPQYSRRYDPHHLCTYGMIKASQTITTMRTFGIFPAMASFGDGYFKPSGRQNRFARHVPQVLPNFHELAGGTILSSPEIRSSTWNDVVNFLTQE